MADCYSCSGNKQTPQKHIRQTKHLAYQFKLLPKSKKTLKEKILHYFYFTQKGKISFFWLLEVSSNSVPSSLFYFSDPMSTSFCLTYSTKNI
jgi:hypothetical protein